MRKTDSYLMSLIFLAMKDESMEHDVTLMVNGLLVTGFIVNYEKWRKHSSTLDVIGGLLEKNAASAETAEAEEAPPLSYIHLRDAKFYSPGQRPIPDGSQGVHVRIPLDAVDGFSLGYIGQAPSQS